MDKEQPTVVVIDDDPAIRESLGRLLRSVGFKAQLWRSVDEFLTSGRPDGPACLVLDVRLPGRSGLDYQRELMEPETRIPVIFITGHGDIRMSVQAMKGGAIEFLTKPFRDQDLLDAVQLAVAKDRAWRENEQVLVELRKRYSTLPPRDREMMALVMRKMHASSVPDLARMADMLSSSLKNRPCCTDRALGASKPRGNVAT